MEEKLQLIEKIFSEENIPFKVIKDEKNNLSHYQKYIHASGLAVCDQNDILVYVFSPCDLGIKFRNVINCDSTGKERVIRRVINQVNLDIDKSGRPGGFIRENNSFIYRVNIRLPQQLDANFTHSLVWTAIADADSIYKEFAPRILKATIFQTNEEMAMQALVNVSTELSNDWSDVIEEVAAGCSLSLLQAVKYENVIWTKLIHQELAFDCEVAVSALVLKIIIRAGNPTIADREASAKKGIAIWTNGEQCTARASFMHGIICQQPGTPGSDQSFARKRLIQTQLVLLCAELGIELVSQSTPL